MRTSTCNLNRAAKQQKRSTKLHIACKHGEEDAKDELPRLQLSPLKQIHHIIRKETHIVRQFVHHCTHAVVNITQRQYSEGGISHFSTCFLIFDFAEFLTGAHRLR